MAWICTAIVTGTGCSNGFTEEIFDNWCATKFSVAVAGN